MSSAPLFGLILAAGQGRRFGGNKLLADLNGSPLLRHVLAWVGDAMQAGRLAGAIGVIPAEELAREQLFLDSKIEYVFNPKPERGVADTLRIGLGALTARHPDAGAALIIQGDQPGIRLDVVDAILAGWRSSGRPVVRPRYSGDPGTPGHPVLLDRSIWTRAAELEGDSGFAPLLAAHPQLLTTIEVSGMNPDINTPSDLASLEYPLR